MKTKTLLSLFCILFSFSSFAQSWTLKSPLGKSRGSSAFSIGTKGYIGTGDRGGAFATSDFWEWDQATNVWTQKANVGSPYWLGVGFSIGTKGYIGAGDGGGFQGTNTLWEWDQATNVWTQKANMGGPALREQAAAFSLGGFGYIGTGTDKYVCPGSTNTSYKDLWQFNPGTNAWTQMANLPGSARYGATGFSIGTKGYITNGQDQTLNFFSDLWEWDQPSNTWSQKANCPGTARSGLVSFSIATKGYMGTGVDKAGNNMNDFWRWDQAVNTWKQMPNFGGKGRYWAVGFSIGNKGYVGTGDSGPVCNDAQKVEETDFWEFSDTTCLVTAATSSDPSITVCKGSTVYVSASGGGTYSWNTGQTTSSIIVYPVVTTTYSVTVTNTSGCSGVVTITIPVDTSCWVTTGIAQLNTEHHVDIMPNPMSESSLLIVSGVEASEPYEVKILDMLGKEVRSINLSGRQNTIERGGLNEGVYFYKIIFRNKSSSSGKIIISRQ